MQAYLILANGTVFTGRSVGAQGTTIGEVVFATGMVGFQETLTDPSYYGQIITQTYPLIGNYGMNSEDPESNKIWARGYIVREACRTPSNFRSEMTLDAFLKQNNIIGIEGIDTRSLTRTLRESGVMNGAITTEFDPGAEPARLAALLPEIRAYAVTGAVAAVTCAQAQTFEPTAGTVEGEPPLHVALLDLGCKKNIVRCLCKRGCRVTVLPGTASPEELAALHADGLMLSNGPGDPAENEQIISNIARMLDTGIPAFGICLGHQLTALAAGAKTTKLKYGHRGANQPVTDFAAERTFITSQNHGYAVVGDTLPAEVGRVSHVNANDKTCEGVCYTKWNCFTVQFHPEANGGPKDTEYLFDRFIANIKKAKGVG
ncbi:MAG: carbamoyl phosphate synthase small subunit [Gemmiger sp.]